MKDIIYKEGIKLRHYKQGNQKVKCPKCQPPHNPRDNPLSVTIKGEDIIFFCHHCNFKGGSLKKKISSEKIYKMPKIKNNYENTELYKFFEKRGNRFCKSM